MNFKVGDTIRYKKGDNFYSGKKEEVITHITPTVFGDGQVLWVSSGHGKEVWVRPEDVELVPCKFKVGDTIRYKSGKSFCSGKKEEVVTSIKSLTTGSKEVPWVSNGCGNEVWVSLKRVELVPYKFKVGDKIKRKDGQPFHTGKLEEVVIEVWGRFIDYTHSNSMDEKYVELAEDTGDTTVKEDKDLTNFLSELQAVAKKYNYKVTDVEAHKNQFANVTFTIDAGK